MSKARVMLAFSFFDNYVAAKTTAKSFGTVAYNQDVVLGLETEQPRNSSNVIDVVDKAGTVWGPSRVFLWDESDTKRLLASWQATGLPFPFFGKYSYGGAVNRLVALAKRERCEYLVRVDPGTEPIGDFGGAVDRHIHSLGVNLKVVSGQYTQRLAIRDEFVPESIRSSYLDLIHECTGIDPRPGRQVTGGAAFTVNVAAGPPAIPFDHLDPNQVKLMVWGSDDGFFQTLLGPLGAAVDFKTFIKRADPGVKLSIPGYVERLSNAVALREAQKGFGDIPAILGSIDRFRDRLKEILRQHPSSIQSANQISAMPPVSPLTAESVLNGYRNYVDLVDQWPSVSASL